GAGYFAVDLAGGDRFSPIGKAVSYRITIPSGNVNRLYTVAVIGSITSGSNNYDLGLVAENEEDGFVTYVVDISRRADGSAWAAGELVTRVLVPLTTPSLNNAVFDVSWLSWG